MTSLSNTSLGVIVITAISLIGTAVVAATGHVVNPDWWTLNFTLVGATAGVAVPTTKPPVPVATVAQVAQQTPVT